MGLLQYPFELSTVDAIRVEARGSLTDLSVLAP